METIKSFQDEHQEALRKLAALGEDLRALRNGAALEEHRRRIEDFAAFLEEALKVHFRREEEALFPALGKYIGLDSGPIAVMLAEHEEIRAAHRELVKELAEERPDVEVVIGAGGTIIDILEPHIDKEDNILFPMAGQVLSPNELAEVDKTAAAIA